MPGAISILKRAPKGKAFGPIVSFVVRSFFFIMAWFVVLLSYVYLIGFFVPVWRLGYLVTFPKDTQYTAYMGDQKIRVTRLIDNDRTSLETIRYIYLDDNGNYYRPPMHL